MLSSDSTTELERYLERQRNFEWGGAFLSPCSYYGGISIKFLLLGVGEMTPSGKSLPHIHESLSSASSLMENSGLMAYVSNKTAGKSGRW